MRLQFPRQEFSSRRKLAALLALLTPSVAWSEAPSRGPHDAEASLRKPADARRLSTEQPSEGTQLVPLPPELSGTYGSVMPLVGPVSRSAGLPADRSQVPLDLEDRWLPRGSYSVTRTAQAPTPLQPPKTAPRAQAEVQAPLINSTLQIVTGQRAGAATTAAADAVALNGPMSLAAPNNTAASEDAPAPQKEPAASATAPESAADTAPAADTPSPAAQTPAADTAPADRQAPADQQATADELPTMEIRRLHRSEKSQPAESATRGTDANTAPSGTRMTVGDVPPEDSIDEALGAQPQPGEAPPVALTPERPIQGDRITPAGELILAAGRSAAGLPVLPHTERLKATIENGLRYYWNDPEDAAVRTHWGMMHSIMIFDRDTQIINRRQRHNAVAWMAGNNPCRNQLLFSQDREGIRVRTGVGLQGHQGQLLAIFGLIDVPLNYPVYAGRQKYAVADILEREKLDCRSGAELTFTLIALAHYADSDTSWVSSDGQPWDVQRVIREELSQPIVGAACGGTHRLMGFAHALRRRQAEGKPITQQWDRADRYVKDFVDYTWTLQNRDGSMSSAWFERPEDNNNIDRKIQTTGHMLEFLLSTVPDSELQTPRMVRCVGYLADAMYNERGRQWQVGPKGHALRALAMYYQRVFDNPAPWRVQPEQRSAEGGGPRAVR